MTTELDPHMCLPEPELMFHPDRNNDRDIHPLRGLLRFGPHSGILMPDPIRVATISPAGESDHLYGFMKELNSEYAPTERREYLPKWPGFRSVFGLHMRGAGQGCHIELSTKLDSEFIDSETPHILLADCLVRAIQDLDARRAEFDVPIVEPPV